MPKKRKETQPVVPKYTYGSKEFLQEYTGMYKNDPVVHKEMPTKFKKSAISQYFTAESYPIVYKWLKRECTHERRQQFFSFLKLFAGSPTAPASQPQYTTQNLHDPVFNTANMYCHDILTKDNIHKMAHWLKNKASTKEAEQFKDLFASLSSFSTSLAPKTTVQETYRTMPKYEPDKLLSKAIHEVAIRQTDSYKKLEQIKLDRLKPVQQTNNTTSKPFKMQTSYTLNYPAKKPDPPEPTPIDNWKKKPYAVMSTVKFTDSQVSTTRSAYQRPKSATISREREVVDRFSHPSAPITTASVGSCTPGFAADQVVLTKEATSSRPSSASKPLSTHRSAFETSAPKPPVDKRPSSTSLTTYNRTFVGWKTARPSHLRESRRQEMFNTKIPYGTMSTTGATTEYGHSFAGLRPRTAAARTAW